MLLIGRAPAGKCVTVVETVANTIAAAARDIGAASRKYAAAAAIGSRNNLMRSGA